MLKLSHNIKNSLIYFGLLTVSLAPLVGCSTRASRIDSHRAEFSDLTSEQQLQVQNGSVENGYTQSMVFLSQGTPDSVDVISVANPRRELWIYKRSKVAAQPHAQTGFYGAYSSPQFGGGPSSPTPMVYNAASLVVELTDGIVTKVINQ